MSRNSATALKWNQRNQHTQLAVIRATVATDEQLITFLTAWVQILVEAVYNVKPSPE